MANPVRVREIIGLLRQAERDGSTQSEYNWRAAKLIWEEVQAGTLQKDLAEQTGKSTAHISRLKKCWQVFVVDVGVEIDDFSHLGSFYEAYNSPEVHGESQRGNPRNRAVQGQKMGGRNRRSGEDEDFSAHGLITKMFTCASILANNPAFWPLIAPEDWDALERVPALLERLTREPNRA